MKFNTILNYQEYKGQINNKPSMTVPDQAMSIKEILTRFSRGLSVGGFPTSFDDIDDPDDMLPDPRTMDLSERKQYEQMVKEELNHIRSKAKPAETVGLTETETEG
jgi:hypothetical protein